MKWTWLRSHADVNFILFKTYDTFRQQQQLQQQDQTPNLQDKATLSSSTPEADEGIVF